MFDNIMSRFYLWDWKHLKYWGIGKDSRKVPSIDTGHAQKHWIVRTDALKKEKISKCWVQPRA
jgi:hypothetical protein